MEKDSAFMSVEEAYQQLGGDRSPISLRTLYRAAERGEILSMRVGKRILVSRAGFQEKFGTFLAMSALSTSVVGAS